MRVGGAGCGAAMRLIMVAALAGVRTCVFAYQDPNATAEMKYRVNTCVAAPCNNHGPCTPRFSRAVDYSTVRKGTAWVIHVTRARRSTQSDWANMEHFAATTLPQYEALWASKTGVDYVVLPQVSALRNFHSARGADTDWFKEMARTAKNALSKRADADARVSVDDAFLVFRGDLGRSTCYERVVHASSWACAFRDSWSHRRC